MHIPGQGLFFWGNEIAFVYVAPIKAFAGKGLTSQRGAPKAYTCSTCGKEFDQGTCVPWHAGSPSLLMMVEQSL